jgi:eukaryotic-like serine/threonine-protein kinase
MREPPDNCPMTEETIFAEALGLSPASRREFVERHCGTNGLEVDSVMALLESYQRSSTFLEVPAAVGRQHQESEFTAPLPSEPVPGDRIGHYQLRERIGEGGFGVVYLAEQEAPVRRRVAMKIIRLGLDTREFIARFEAERQALALMDHPGIARVIDAGATATGRPYLVMELIRGTPITKYCDEHNCSVRARLELFARVCGAVQHAHQKGVIHCDLKPSNILVAVENGEPLPKIIDFGIAKATRDPLTDQTLSTLIHALVGTPAYTSPEQMEMGVRDVDTRSDIYSLGVLLYELLTGCQPFDRAVLQRASFDEMRRIVREVEPPRPSERVSELVNEERVSIAARRDADPARLPVLLRSELDWIVMRCLEKDRSRRYETPMRSRWTSVVTWKTNRWSRARRVAAIAWGSSSGGTAFR